MKKFWKYFTLTILFLLGLGCVGVLYLFFVPTSTLFSIAYTTQNETIISEKYKTENLVEVQLLSNNYNVNVIATETEEVSVKMFSNAFGFVKAKNENASIISNYNSDKNIAKFEVIEPSGFIFKGSSYINLYIPNNKELDLTIKNNKATTVLELSETGVKTLSYTAENGKAQLESGKVTTLLNLTLNKSNFEISEDAIVNEADVKLSVTTGKFDAYNSTFKDIDIVKNDRGVILLKSCNNITENVETAGGRIEAEEASYVNVKSSETNVYITKITNGAIIELSGSGKIKIDELSGAASTLQSGYGSININKVNSEIYVKTTNGSIDVSNAYLLINLLIEGSGKATIKFAEDAEHHNSNNRARSVYALLKSGTLHCTGIENVDASSSGNSSIYANFINLYGENEINNTNGSTSIVINKDSVYKLTTNPDKDTVASVRVNLSQIAEYNGYTNKSRKDVWVNCEENANLGNTLTVANETGSILILDTNFAK